MPEQQSTQSSPLSCTYCPESGADVCVRSMATSSGPHRPVYAHRSCAEARGVRPLYELLPNPEHSDQPAAETHTC
jgi:hypothetical protein